MGSGWERGEIQLRGAELEDGKDGLGNRQSGQRAAGAGQRCLPGGKNSGFEVHCEATEGMWLIGVTGVVCLCGRGAL